MAKRSVVVDMTSYGIYSTWDSKSKDIPKIQEFTHRVEAEIDVEFGYIINIKKAKGETYARRRLKEYAQSLQADNANVLSASTDKAAGDISEDI